MKNKKLRNRIIIITISILVVLLGASAFMFFSNARTAGEELPNYSLIDELRVLQIKGGTLELSEGKINTTLKGLMTKPLELNTELTIKETYTKLKGDNITLYTKIKYNNMEVQPNISANMTVNGDKVVLKFNSIKIGKLPVPKSMLLSKLREYENDDIKIVGDTIEISKYLLPFSTNNIYLKEGKLFIDILQLPKIGSELSGSTAPGTQTGSTSSSAQNNGNNTNTSSSNTNTTNTSTTNTSNTTGSTTTTNPPQQPASIPAPVAKSMDNISDQMGGVIAAVETPTEKAMMARIQSVVNAVKENPNYSYRAEANEVKAWYGKLDGEGKTRVKNAILNNVNVMDILKLINIFGV